MSGEDADYNDADPDYIPIEQGESMELEVLDDTDDHWDQERVTAMLNLYLQNIHKFRDPSIRKKNIWTDISSTIGKSPASCDKKFRNLKQTYIRLLKKQSVEGKDTKTKWPFFQVFNEIFCDNGEYQPEIQQRLQEEANKTVMAKALLSIGMNDTESPQSGPTEDKRKTRKRHAELRKATLEMRDRQRTVEEKLDRLISIVEESNNIQKERNKLFEQFLQKFTQNH